MLALRTVAFVAFTAFPVALSACGAEPGSHAGDSGAGLGVSEQAITGGAIVPSFASVFRIAGSDGRCTAVKIAGGRTTTLLTAAHCVAFDAASLTISRSETPGAGTTFSVASVHRHPSYVFGEELDDVTSLYDVAVVVLSGSTRGESWALRGPTPIRVGDDLRGLGYGCDGDDDAPTLRLARFEAATDDDVNEAHSIHDSGGPRTCDGDSGGPLFDSSGQLAGIARAATRGGSTWSRLGNVLGWIDDPRDANDPSLLAGSGSGRAAFITSTRSERGFCLAAASRSRSEPIDVVLHECDGPMGETTGRPPGWMISPVELGVGRSFHVVSRFTGTCLGVDPDDSSGSGAGIVLQTCSSAPFGERALRQAWQFGPVHSTGYGRTIRNLFSGQCLTTSNGRASLGTQVVQDTCGSLSPPSSSGCDDSSGCTSSFGWMLVK